MALILTSNVFEEGGPIPRRNACDGDSTSPPLAWLGAPEGTRSLALIVDDPDAPDPAHPKRVFVHWVLYDIPPTTTEILEGDGPDGAREGQNDKGGTGYTPPCPPIGRHRYFHKLYALDTVLGSLQPPTKATLESAMKGHILDTAELMGTYRKATA
jgi:Raf kinase inhibitor-like YbhB/YbcL family protein